MRWRWLKWAAAAIVMVSALYPKVCWCAVIHATGFSQWLMTKKMSAEFIRQ